MAGEVISEGVSLASVVLRLRSLDNDSRPRCFGDAAKWNFLHALPEDLADKIEKQKHKPYTTSGLLASVKGSLQPARRVVKDGHYYLRLTVLHPELVWALNKAFLGEFESHRDKARGRVSFKPGSVLDMDGVPLVVEAVAAHPTEHPLARQTDFGALAYPAWSGQNAADGSVAIEFISHTVFSKTKGLEKPQRLYVPLPYPELLFGSLAERWNSFAPYKLPADLRDAFADEVMFSRYELRTGALEYKGGSVKIGATGYAAYVAPYAGEMMMNLLSLLAEFALFSGAGLMTTMGFGQMRQIYGNGAQRAD
ncbi:MAG: CRISPR system precrRNA processing endoribonuclease RAMP protein Cas6 [Anaerolineales bacterium]|nr:CRISPR system precrRNA processing endoribonuclease RAMP protein Cas6 [Anaerolineales bacterium]